MTSDGLALADKLWRGRYRYVTAIRSGPTAAVPTVAVPTVAVPTAAVPTAAVPTAAGPAGSAAAVAGGSDEDPRVAGLPGGEEDLRVAAHLAELAWLAAPGDRQVAEARHRVFTIRADRATSTMSTGVFRWAATESLHHDEEG
jgi:hypothetical protein